jgi:hypothetical protein
MGKRAAWEKKSGWGFSGLSRLVLVNVGRKTKSVWREKRAKRGGKKKSLCSLEGLARLVPVCQKQTGSREVATGKAGASLPPRFFFKNFFYSRPLSPLRLFPACT